MKNVCFFNTVNFWGGGEKLHLEYALKLKEKGYNVHLVCKAGSPLAQKAAAAGLPVFAATVKNTSYLNPFKYFPLYRFFRKEQIDTVIFSSSQDVKLGGFSARIAGVARIVYLRGLAVPIRNNIINRYLFSRVLTHLIANSEETKRTMRSHLADVVPPERIKVIYHGIDLRLFDENSQKAKNNKKREGFVFGNAGRLTTQKGQQYLVEVAKKLKDKGRKFTLVIAGTGDMQAALEQQIIANGLQEEVVLQGFVKEMEAFMHSIDLFVLSSEWEGFGYVLVEAMAAGKPVIAFDISSNPEIVAHRKTGYLVDFPDTDLFCDRISQLMDDGELRQQMGLAGRQRVEKMFRLEQVADELEEYLKGKS